MSAACCKHHPSVPARYHCLPCRTHFCSRCARTEYVPEPVATCPHCQRELQTLSASNLITPFWRRIPKFFIYPFNPAALAYIVVLAVLSMILFRPTFVGALIQVIPFLVFLRYAYAVLTHTALGHMTPPPIDFDMINSGLEMPFKQLGVYIFIGLAANVLLSFVGPLVAAVYTIFMVACLPATAMVIAIENSFLRAINPVPLLGVILRVGWPYLVLCIFLLILWGGTNVVMQFMVGSEGSLRAALLVYNLASMYFLLVMFHMMGYVIYQFHEELAFDVEVDPEDQGEFGKQAGGTGASLPDHPVVSEAEVLVKQGNIPQAIEVLKDGVARDNQDLKLQEHLHKLLKIAGRAQSLAELAPAYIRNLLARHHSRKAADVFADVVAVDPSFRLTTPDHVLPIARELKQSGRARAALTAMDGFAKQFPGHNDIPDTYFLAAKTLCEDFKQDGKARGILEQLLARYPHHPRVDEIRSYLSTIENLVS